MSSSRDAFESIDAYQTGLMSEADAAGFEEELFTAAEAGGTDEARFVDRVSLIGQYLAPRAGLEVGSSRKRVDELIAAGLRVQLIDPAPAPVIQLPPIEADAELVATRVPIDVRGFDSIDVTISRPDGTEIKTFRDVGFDPHDGTIYLVCEAPLARLSARHKRVVSRIIAKRAGQEQTLAVFEALAH